MLGPLAELESARELPVVPEAERVARQRPKPAPSRPARESRDVARKQGRRPRPLLAFDRFPAGFEQFFLRVLFEFHGGLLRRRAAVHYLRTITLSCGQRCLLPGVCVNAVLRTAFLLLRVCLRWPGRWPATRGPSGGGRPRFAGAARRLAEAPQRARHPGREGGGEHHDQAAAIAAATGYFTARKIRKAVSPSSASEATQFVTGSGLVLRTARVEDFRPWADRATPPQTRAATMRHVLGHVGQRRPREQGRRGNPDERVHEIPDRVDDRDLVGEELDDVERRRDEDDPLARQHREAGGERERPARPRNPRTATVA